MSRTQFVKSFVRSVPGGTKQMAESVYDDVVRIADDVAVTAADQPARVAREGSRTGRYVALGVGTAGVGAGGGLAASELIKRDAARIEAASEQEKVKLIEGILNDPNVAPEDRAEMIDALAKAGVFTREEEDGILQRLGLGGVKGASLSPVKLLGGGVTGWVMFFILLWFILKAMDRGGG